MKFLKYIYEIIDSNMYIAIEGQSALIIDPNINEAALKRLNDKQVRKLLIILTHEHYDHISGVNWLREHFSCTVVCSKACADNMLSELKNGSKFFSVLFLNESEEKMQEAKKVKPITCEADSVFSGIKELCWEGHDIILYETPGHSAGSICINFDQKYLFTGDSLLKGLAVITKLPTGDKKRYYDTTLPFLRTLDRDLWVFPGHGDDGVLREFLD